MNNLASLSLNKRTVAILDNSEMSNVKGGFTSALRRETRCKTDTSCNTTTICKKIK